VGRSSLEMDSNRFIACLVSSKAKLIRPRKSF
jgi:hypothetical protein